VASTGWSRAIKNKAEKLNVSEEEAQKILEAEREGERLIVLEWLRAGAPKKAYDDDAFPLPARWNKSQPATQALGNKDEKKIGVLTDDGKQARIALIMYARCVRCHGEGEAAEWPLETHEQIQKYMPVKAPGPPEREPALSKERLAQTTHVHLLGFSMMYGLTGLIFANTRWPGLLRLAIAPLPLLAQVVDVACWWVARMDAPYGIWAANTIMITGGIVGAGLFAHILLSLFDMYRIPGKIILFALMAGVIAGGYVYVKPIVEAELKA